MKLKTDSKEAKQWTTWFIAICLFNLGFSDSIDGQGSRAIVCPMQVSLTLHQEGILTCNFAVTFTKVFWYYGDDKTAFISRHLGDSKNVGESFALNKFDIAEDGSLVIKNITLENERTYRVMIVWNEETVRNEKIELEENIMEFYITVSVTVPTLEKFPAIGTCETDQCCMFVPHPEQRSHLLSLQCCMTGKPLNLTWYKHTSDSPVKIIETPSTENPPLKRCLRTAIDITDHDIMDLMCAPSGRAVKPTTGNASVLVLKETDFLYEEWFHINGTLKLGTERNQTGIWTRKTETFNCHVIVSTDVRITTSPDQLVIQECNDNDAGLYFFIYKYEGTYRSKTYDVKSVLPPNQAKSYIEGCIFPDNCSITIHQNKVAGILTCKTSDVRPEPTVEWIPCKNQTGIEFPNGKIPPLKPINETERLNEVVQILHFKFLKASSCNLSCIISNKWFKKKHISRISLRYGGKDEL